MTVVELVGMGDGVRRGDIVWIDAADIRGGRGGQRRPHVVVQDDVFNRSRIETVVVCAISTNRTRGREPGNVLLDAGEGGLDRPGIVLVSHVSVADKAALSAPIGRLSAARVDAVVAGLRFQQASFFDSERGA